MPTVVADQWYVPPVSHRPGCGNAVVSGDSIPTAVAVRAKTPRKLDGRDDDAVWQIAPKGDEFNDLFGLHPENTVLIKVAYWINR